MVTNERQYGITKAAAAKFVKSIAAAEKSPPAPGVHPRLHQASIDSMRWQLRELRRELRLYDGLKKARGKTKFAGHLNELTLLLAQARIARGWNQRELGERIGASMQQVQRDEAGGYARASLERVGRVCHALGVRTAVTLKLIKLQDWPEKPGSVSV